MSRSADILSAVRGHPARTYPLATAFSLSRQGQLIIAQPFSWLGTRRYDLSGSRRDDRKHSDFCRPFGTLDPKQRRFPAIDRWAIFGRPYGTRFASRIAIAAASRFTPRCSPDLRSLIETSPRVRSSSPTIATNGMPRDEAYLN